MQSGIHAGASLRRYLVHSSRRTAAQATSSNSASRFGPPRRGRQLHRPPI